MGLWCTAFGHDWGAPETDENRREEGKEVVVTVREVRTCNRCDAEEVLGESVEVTAIEPARSEVESGDPDHVPGRTHGEQPQVDGDGPPVGGQQDGRYEDPATDDGVILEGSDEVAVANSDVGRQPGEWPGRPERADTDSGLDGEPRPWPDPKIGHQDDPDQPDTGWVDTLSEDRAGDDREQTSVGSRKDDTPIDGPAGGEPAPDEPSGIGSQTGEPDDGEKSMGRDAVSSAGVSEPTDARLSAGERDSAAGEVGPGARPEDDAEVLDATESNEQTRVTAAEPVDPNDASSVPPRTESDREDATCYCPECGFVHDQPNPSFRGGDVCPNCRRSYLAERKE